MGIVRKDSCVARVYFFYKSGQILFSGGFDTCNFDKKTGPFNYYNKKGIYKLDLYEPSKYPGILFQYRGVLANFPPQADSLRLRITFYDNQKVKSIGYISECCIFTGPYYYFLKSGHPIKLYNYENNKLNGPFIEYNIKGDGIWCSGYFKDDKRDGEWIYYNGDGKTYLTEIYKDGKIIKKLP